MLELCMQCIGKKMDILLWCHFVSYESKADKSWKRVNVMDRDLAPSAKRDACAEKISEDEKIVVRKNTVVSIPLRNSVHGYT